MNRALVAIALVLVGALSCAWLWSGAREAGAPRAAEPDRAHAAVGEADGAASLASGSRRASVPDSDRAPGPSASPAGTESTQAADPEGTTHPDPNRLRGTLRLVAQVVDGQGNPIPAARFVVSRTGTVVGESDGAGRVDGELDALEGWFWTDWPNGHARSFRVDVLAEGFAGEGRNVRLGDGGGVVDLGTLVLEPGGRVVGRAVHADGTPGVGLTVRWQRVEPSEDGGSASRIRRHLRHLTPGGYAPEAETDAHGAFVLEGLSVGPCELVCDLPHGQGRGSERTHVMAGVTTEATLTLPQLAELHSLEGRVLNADGTPAAGAVVAWIRSQWAPDRPRSLWHSTTADPAGRFSISDLQPMSIAISAHAAGEPLRSVLLDEVLSDSGAVELRLLEPDWIELVPTDAGGRPIPWSHVQPMPEKRHFQTPLLPAGESGVVRVPRPTVPFYVRAFGLGFRAETFGPLEPPATQERMELRLTPASVLRGLVLRDGRPVRGASVFLLQTPNALDLAPAKRRIGDSANVARGESPFTMFASAVTKGVTATTDREGRFVASIPNPAEYGIRVEAEGSPVSTFGTFPCSPELPGPDVVLELQAGGVLEGTVARAPDVPVEGTTVGISNGWGLAWTTTVGEDGAYRFENLQPGPWQLRACEPSSRGPEELLLRLRPDLGTPVEWDFEVVAGEVTTRDLDLTGDGQFVVTGSVRVGDLPTSGWMVSLGRADATDTERSPEPTPALIGTEVDDAGRFWLAASSGGPRWITLAGEGWKIREPLHLIRGEVRWDVDLGMGRLELHWPGGALPDGRRLQIQDLVVETPAGPVAFQSLILRRGPEEGELSIDLPVGRGSVRPRAGAAGQSSEVLATFDIGAGDTTSVHLP